MAIPEKFNSSETDFEFLKAVFEAQELRRTVHNRRIITSTPEGFSTVNSYFVVGSAEKYLEFLKAAFEAQELGRTVHDGRIANAQIRIGESTVMVSEASDRFPATKSCLYLYVDDADKTFKKAVDSGAESMMEPMDMPYGDRQGMLVDPAGNIWFPSTRVNDDQFNS